MSEQLQAHALSTDTSIHSVNPEKRARRCVLLIQLLFFISGLWNLSGPFVSAHNERQNQTFETARYVFREGWSAVLMPKTSFSLPGHESQPFTIAHQQVPTHGLLGWPFVRLFGHEAAVVVLISLVFSVASIELIYRIIRVWLEPLPAALGAGLWSSSPLLLHFGQVPMPDILCTAGILASFLFAVQGRLTLSSICFLFAILTKASVTVFGLPILTALLVAKGRRSLWSFLETSLLWGLGPLVGLSWWIWLEITHPDIPWTVINTLMGERGKGELASPGFYITTVACLFPFGSGLLGLIGMVLSLRQGGSGMNKWIKWSLIFSNLIYLFSVVRKIPEPQYFLPLVAWSAVAAAFSFPFLVTKLKDLRWRLALGVALVLHAGGVAFFTNDLKASRVPDFSEIERVARVLPTQAKVIVVYRFYGASPAVWLNRNVFGVLGWESLDAQLPTLRDAGYSHVLIMDMASRHGGLMRAQLKNVITRLFYKKIDPPKVEDVKVSNFSSAGSPERRYCDQRFPKILEGNHVVLYSLDSKVPSDPASQPSQ